jgi:hypothetical protein
MDKDGDRKRIDGWTWLKEQARIDEWSRLEEQARPAEDILRDP